MNILHMYDSDIHWNVVGSELYQPTGNHGFINKYYKLQGIKCQAVETINNALHKDRRTMKWFEHTCCNNQLMK